MTDLVTRIQQDIKPIIESMDCELWGVRWQARLLQVFIEKNDGIKIEDCAAVSRELTAYFDVEDLIPDRYQLEVSSPGLDCILFTFAQYEKHLGQQVKLLLKAPYEGQRQFKGILFDTHKENDEIVLRCNEDEFLFPFDLIEQAHLVPCF
ncbi:MAG: ribosome maturation factor RimP [Endozoicomonadaceae bacterium]|nr:ribosome maturation factor RimP [Endozoicomonadaceae bacterium]